jgi:hypothetical protein
VSVSFAPLKPDAVRFLMDRTGIDYRHCDFANSAVWFCATARDAEGRIQGVWVAEFQVWFEAHVTTAIDDPRFMSRRLLRTLFTALFSQAVRVTAMVRPDNHRSIEGIKRLGFRYEGFCRLGIEGKWDAMVFGMLRNECRWLQRHPKGRTVSYEIATAS